MVAATDEKDGVRPSLCSDSHCLTGVGRPLVPGSPSRLGKAVLGRWSSRQRRCSGLVVERPRAGDAVLQLLPPTTQISHPNNQKFIWHLNKTIL